MKKIILLITIILSPAMLNAQENKPNCETTIQKLKPSCNTIGTGFNKLKKFSERHKTVGQSLGIEKKETKTLKTLKEFAEENKTIDQTLKNIKKK